METSAPSDRGGGGGGAEVCTLVALAIGVSASGKSQISHRDRPAWLRYSGRPRSGHVQYGVETMVRVLHDDCDCFFYVESKIQTTSSSVWASLIN